MQASHPKNVLNYCPKCGDKAFDYDGSRSFKCAKCGFHFFINSAAAVAAVIINEKSEVLLTTRAFDPCKGMLDLPGGFVDPMETAEEAVCREIKEELNLDVLKTTYLVSFPNEYVFSGYSVYTTDLAFVCEVKSFDNMHVQDDISDFAFYPEESINYEDVSSGSIRDIIRFYFSER